MPSNPLELKYKQDGDEAKEIAKYLPYFPFKVSAFYGPRDVAQWDLECFNMHQHSQYFTISF
jgi:hypothetical protein